MLDITGAELKDRFGFRFSVDQDIVQMPTKHHMMNNIALYRVREELDVCTRFDDWSEDKPRYFETEQTAVAAACQYAVQKLSARAARFDKMVEHGGLRSKWILFRHSARDSRWLSWLALPEERQRLIDNFLVNGEYIKQAVDTYNTNMIDVDRIPDDQVYQLAGPLLDVGQKVFRVCWAWPESDGVTLDELTVRDISVYDERGVERYPIKEEQPDFLMYYSVAPYGEDDERTNMIHRENGTFRSGFITEHVIHWENGILRSGFITEQYFTTREEAEAFQAKKRAELVAKIQGL